MSVAWPVIASHGNHCYINSKIGDIHRPHNSTTPGYAMSIVRPTQILPLIYLPHPLTTLHCTTPHSLPALRLVPPVPSPADSRINTTTPACSYHISKSSAIIFARAGRRFIQPRSVTLFGEPINWVDTIRYLGVTLDKLLIWLPYIE